MNFYRRLKQCDIEYEWGLGFKIPLLQYLLHPDNVMIVLVTMMMTLFTGVKLMSHPSNCNYGHPKMADVESGKNLCCRLNCFYNVFLMAHALVR